VWALGVPTRRVFYVPNGVGRRGGRDREERPVRSGDPPIILLYTRFVECSIHQVVDLFSRVRARVPDASLLVVGEGRADEPAQLMDLAASRGLAEGVTYAGWEPAELPGHFARSALAIYPFEDTLINRAKSPAKLLELLEAGVPVVAEGVGEIREFIRDGETGWVVGPGRVDAFSDAVTRLLLDRGLRESIGDRAAVDVRTRLSWDLSADAVEKAYAAAQARA
jgi:glycosyltransferase involved in cell wall biosynthesis